MRASAVLSTALALLACAHADDGGKAVFGYLPEWRYQAWPEHEQVYRWGALCEHVTHLILFSIEMGADGSLRATDRFPNSHIMKHAKKQCAGSKLMICFGGNGRTAGFPKMVAGREGRRPFLRNLKALVDEHGLQGVDYNWEYPKTENDWHGLARLVRDTRDMFGPDFVISVAYYPDGEQEQRMAGIADHVDYFLSMCYDQPGEHSTWKFTERCVANAVKTLPKEKVALGLPFYARNVRSGAWKTYEDIWKQNKGVAPQLDRVGDEYFNGRATIRRKTEYARAQGLGGVMIWEVGQDAFSNKKKSLHSKASLLLQIGHEMRAGDTSAEGGDL